MSLFGKKPEPQPSLQPHQSHQPHAPVEERPAQGRSYGVAELIRLLKSIPVDQHPDLVVRVVKTTLESVGVLSSQVVEDALRQENAIGERIAVLEGEIEGLASEIQSRKEQITQLRAELSETTYAKERLQSAEGILHAAPPPGVEAERVPHRPSGDPGAHASKPRSLPPPLPPPLHKGKPPEPATGT
jgi:hypothetical protein